MKFLKQNEGFWRLKGWEILLKCGDKNTKKIKLQDYAKGRKYVKTIWSLNDKEGILVTTFNGRNSVGFTIEVYIEKTFLYEFFHRPLTIKSWTMKQ